MPLKKVLTHHRYADSKLKEVSDWKVSDQTKKDIRQFIEDYKSGEVTGRIGTNLDATIERVLQLLKPSLTFLEKNKQDIKKFKDTLLKDKIKSDLRKPYSLRTKKMMLSTLTQFLKWKHPENHNDLIKPLQVRIESKKPEPKSLSLNEIDKLYKNCKNNKERYVIANLFSSGARAEEFLNIRHSDITLPEKNESFVTIRIREGFSKTEGRTIKLYYDKSLEATREFLNQRKQEGIEPDEPVIKDSYGAIKDWLVRIGQRVLKKNVHFHLFRSSCATWISSKINRNQMCIHFGWKFSSNMPDVYIKRQGVDMKEVTETFERSELEQIKNKLEKTNQEKSMEIEGLKSDFQNLMNFLKSKHRIKNLLEKHVEIQE
jgi:integrase